MILNVLRLISGNNEVSIPFKYKGVTLNLTEYITSDIDIISFDNVGLPVDVNQIDNFIEIIKNHQFYKFACDNPNIPKIFFYVHEYIHLDMYSKLIQILCEILNTNESKVTIYDTRLFTSSNSMFHPLENRIKQFDFFDWCINPDVLLIPKPKIKKFTSLMNKVNLERFMVFDRIIKSYDDDIVSLRNENTISFRNVIPVHNSLSKYKNDNKYKKYAPLLFDKEFTKLNIEQLELVRQDNQKIYDIFNNFYSLSTLDNTNNIFLPNPNISDLIPHNLEGEYLHKKEFFEEIELPWVLDYENIHNDALKFFKTLDIYSTSYFSIIADSYSGNSKEDSSFTEKLLNPMIVGNLPFLVNVSYYYDFFEEAGFDFSYLKDLFGIEYKNMITIRDAYNNVDKFVSYFKYNSLEKVKEDYHKFKHIADSNQQIMKQIWIDKIPTESEWKFLNQIKQEKHISL